MEPASKKYYLETNVLYSLINKIHLFIDRLDVATSLFTYDELISGLSENQYHRRKVLISKLKASGLKIYPFFPIECIAISFGIDISTCPIIIEKKALLWEQVNLVISCDDYLEYTNKLHEKINVSFSEAKESIDTFERESAKFLNTIIKKNYSELREINARREIVPEYVTINIEDLLLDPDKRPDCKYEREILVQTLKACNIIFDDTDIGNAITKYDGHQLVAFILGEMLYMWDRSCHSHMKQAGKNDISDLKHLLYLKDENYVIVSDDKIFEYSTMIHMRITCDKLLEMVDN